MRATPPLGGGAAPPIAELLEPDIVGENDSGRNCAQHMHNTCTTRATHIGNIRNTHTAHMHNTCTTRATQIGNIRNTHTPHTIQTHTRKHIHTYAHDVLKSGY